MIKVNGVKTKLPVTRNIVEHIKTLKYKKKLLIIRYYDLYSQLIQADNIKSYEKEYTELVNNIHNIENDIDVSYMHLEKLNQPFQKKLNKLEIQYQETKDMKIAEKIQKLQEEYVYKDYIIEEGAEGAAAAPAAVKHVSSEKKEAIKKNVKDLMAQVFPFKNKKECESKKKKEPYYVSKEDLITRIKKQPEIESMLPPKYSKMTKEKICEQLFS